MTAKSDVLTVERRIAAHPQTVFDAWLDPESVGRWLFATQSGVMARVEVDPRVGGRFAIVERREAGPAEHFGEYREIDRPRRLAFDFWTSFSAERTRVTVIIVPDREGSLLTLTHEGVWADYRERTRDGWAIILDGLARVLAGGT